MTKDFALKEDELRMTKEDVKDMIEGLIIRSKRSNFTKWGVMYRTTLRGFKGFMEIIPEHTLEQIWSDILRFFNLLIIRNKMEIEKGNSVTLETIFSTLKDDIKKGNW